MHCGYQESPALAGLSFGCLIDRVSSAAVIGNQAASFSTLSGVSGAIGGEAISRSRCRRSSISRSRCRSNSLVSLRRILGFPMTGISRLMRKDVR